MQAVFHNARRLFPYQRSGSPSSLSSAASYCRAVANEQCSVVEFQVIGIQDDGEKGELTHRRPREEKRSADARGAPWLVGITTKFDRILNIPSAHKRKQGIRQRLIIALKNENANRAGSLPLQKTSTKNAAKARTASSPTKLRPISASRTTASGSISRTTFSAARPVFPVHRPCVTRCFVKRQYPVDASGRGGGGAVSCSHSRTTTSSDSVREAAIVACARAEVGV